MQLGVPIFNIWMYVCLYVDFAFACVVVDYLNMKACVMKEDSVLMQLK